MLTILWQYIGQEGIIIRFAIEILQGLWTNPKKLEHTVGNIIMNLIKFISMGIECSNMRVRLQEPLNYPKKNNKSRFTARAG